MVNVIAIWLAYCAPAARNAKAITHGLPFYRGGARRQNRTVPAYGLPPITARRFALLTASLVPPRSSNGNEIAIPAVSLPKGQTMIVKKTNQPTHRAYAVRKTGQDTIYWAEIGAA